MKLKILGNKIVFKFVQEVTNGKFDASTNWGFKMETHTDDAKYARWGEVVYHGPETHGIAKGDYILIEPLMWTTYMEVDNTKMWGTNKDKIIAVSKTKPEGLI